MGRSGSGKSTLLRCINGLEGVNEGTIRVAGAHVAQDDLRLKALRQKVGMIFRQFNLFPHLTARENVVIAQRVVKKTPRSGQPSHSRWP
ncbi:ATP-binding cassette domain-containing protein [Paracoccus aminovorans]|uniref:ATP-binding cassette domain-containing protein n=1 Tax=Paracoccus aminovorans TaxID=34004 RepID=UPI0038CD5C02